MILKLTKGDNKMARELKGMANHVFSEKEITSLEVHILTPPNEKPFITIGAGEESIIINSKEQWKQLNAIVLNTLEEIEEE